MAGYQTNPMTKAQIQKKQTLPPNPHKSTEYLDHWTLDIVWNWNIESGI
jgi:hypothetical protein